jgi:hypothetical protein
MVSSKYNFDRSPSEYFDESINIYQREGIWKLLVVIIEHTYGRIFDLWHSSIIREHLPVTGYVKYNQVIVEKVKLFDKTFFPSFYKDNPTLEEQYVRYIRNYVESGENVNIIGGRYGVSTVAAGENVGKNGSVTTFEATNNGCELTRKTIKLNNLENIANVVQAVIGDAVSVNVKNNKKDPVELFDCDTLAIDCDGCEFEVLQKINSTPKRLIVEHHPVNPISNEIQFQYDVNELKRIVESKGYTIVDSNLEGDNYHFVAEKITQS